MKLDKDDLKLGIGLLLFVLLFPIALFLLWKYVWFVQKKIDPIDHFKKHEIFRKYGCYAETKEECLERYKY